MLFLTRYPVLRDFISIVGCFIPFIPFKPSHSVWIVPSAVGYFTQFWIIPFSMGRFRPVQAVFIQNANIRFFNIYWKRL
ncbi:MAG TPA: hypothetical protein DCW98_00940 [Bacteroidales bacterium]|nr:hypothetical protein [Bacteroidales bacterium]